VPAHAASCAATSLLPFEASVMTSIGSTTGFHGTVLVDAVTPAPDRAGRGQVVRDCSMKCAVFPVRDREPWRDQKDKRRAPNSIPYLRATFAMSIQTGTLCRTVDRTSL